jgi:catechol 2,3-dioxygenase-like lactoylglutathione lyase family enzyme
LEPVDAICVTTIGVDPKAVAIIWDQVLLWTFCEHKRFSCVVKFELDGIDHVALSVRDVERAAKWYCDVLGFERQHDEVWNGIPVFVAKGATAIALFPVRSENPKPPNWEMVTMLHLAFRADRENFLLAQRDLKERGIKFHFQDHEISHSIYFHDPEGHELEITTCELA